MKKLIIFILISIFCFVNSAFAIYGVRPLGMGSAFVGLANDATCVYYNPAGLALNPGVDMYAATVIHNRNQRIGDNFVSLKMCFETEMSPFAWVLGVGAVSILALDGAKYLYDTGVVKKGWRIEEDKYEKEEPMAEEVKEKGEEKKVDVEAKAKEKVIEVAEKTIEKTTRVAKEIAKEAAKEVVKEEMRVGRSWYPGRFYFYQENYSRPSYWERRHYKKQYSPSGKAQFSLGFSAMFDKNPSADQDTNYYTMTVATGYEERISLGANFNLYSLKVLSTGIKGIGAGLDLGGIFRPQDNFSLGMNIREILTTGIHWENNAKTYFGMGVDVGVAVEPVSFMTVTGDIHNIFGQNDKEPTFHYGLELRPIAGIAFRAGLNDTNKTAGMSIGFYDFIIDYAILGGIYGRTQIVSGTYKL